MRSGHPLAVGLYLLSWIILISFAEDILFSAYPNALPVQALKQST